MQQKDDVNGIVNANYKSCNKDNDNHIHDYEK